MQYREIQERGRLEVERLIAEDRFEELRNAVIDVAMAAEDYKWAEDVCIRLSQHSDPVVRGNAVLGFGHLARRFGSLELDVVLPIAKRALNDSDAYVQGHADSALDDIQMFMR